MRLKSVLAGVIAGLIGCAAIAPFTHVSAYDLPTGTTHISSDTLVAWLGDSLSAQYVGTDLEYHATTARRINANESIVSSDMDGYTSNLYNGRTMAWYLVDIPSADAFTAYAYAPIVTIDFNLHLQNITYCDFGFAYYVSNKYQNVSYATCQPYCFLDYNYQGQYNKLYNPPAAGIYSGHLGTFGTALSPQYGTHYGGGIVQLSGSASDLYLGTLSACCLGNFNGGLVVGISLLDIILNEDYVLASSAPPPQGGDSGEGDTPSVPSNGTINGQISENSSGGYDVNYNIEISMPDYTPYINPDWDSAQKERVDGARENVDQYHTAEEGLLSEADNGLSSIPDMEFDESLIEDAENPFSEFFGINIVGIMIFWVGAIAFISYILFGKWV